MKTIGDARGVGIAQCFGAVPITNTLTEEGSGALGGFEESAQEVLETTILLKDSEVHLREQSGADRGGRWIQVHPAQPRLQRLPSAFRRGAVAGGCNFSSVNSTTRAEQGVEGNRGCTVN